MASQDWFDKDFYAVLGVSKDATGEEIRKTYRKLARQFHPDSNQGDPAAEERFKQISEAYTVLKDPEQRAEYDQIRAMGSGARFSAGGPGGGFEDVFGGMFGGQGGQRVRFEQSDFSDLFGGMFGGQGGRRSRAPARGSDIVASTTISFAQAINGETMTLQSGDGRQVTVRIPAGVKDGQKIKLRGKGRPSPEGGEPGDLVITVTVRPHPVFTRDGQNLRVEVPVTFVEAALGATIEVPTLGGPPVKLKVPAGTPSGRTLRVKGKGIHGAKGDGDLLVTIQIAVPTRLPDPAREALLRFAEAMPQQSPRDDLMRKAAS
ncbi:MAG: DnaJ C-terminal domain-containing protein [Microbacterium sp.]|nr:DnaJ C-terminal domain-containing protein [Microbacterium sp.]